MPGTININGCNIVGSNISIVNGKVSVDGKDYTPDSKDIAITVHGDVQSIKADACSKIEVSGDVVTVSTMSGDVRCGNVTGSVSSMSGDVHCGHVGGGVKSMSGDIIHSQKG